MVSAPRLLALGHRPEAEPELRPVDLGLRVLVAPLEPGQADDTHDQQRVAGLQVDRGRLRGDLAEDAEPVVHRGDRQRVRRVQAQGTVTLDDCLGLRGRELAAGDVGGGREHVVSEAEAEVRGH